MTQIRVLTSSLNCVSSRIPQSQAISVHKAQGSAFKWVIIPVVPSKLLDRTMLYTAINRAVETVVLIGEADHINEVIALAPMALERHHTLGSQP
ncbi:ATP-binding domain-containing protein [Rhizobium ruizarguesonis]